MKDIKEYLEQINREQDASSKLNFHGIINDVRLLGFDAECPWNRDEEGLHL